MTKARALRSAILGMAGLAIMALAGTATAAGFMPWEDIVRMAAKHNGMMTMEDATSLSEREKQFSGFAPWVSENMKILDTNHDGMVSMDEIHMWMIANKVNNDDLVKVWYRTDKN